MATAALALIERRIAYLSADPPDEIDTSDDDFTRMCTEASGFVYRGLNKQQRDFADVCTMIGVPNNIPTGRTLCVDLDLGARAHRLNINALLLAAVSKYLGGYINVVTMDSPALEGYKPFVLASDDAGGSTVIIFHVMMGMSEFSVSLLGTFKLRDLGIDTSDLNLILSRLAPATDNLPFDAWLSLNDLMSNRP